ncbi:MAG: tetratricopeptide repeat protein [Acidobacteria bacterium]|jgi:tetratricopeptide (TPR) repeat protein|nr:tetratricopeptide repeat protein [Acidobacteriota bacterium]
MENHVNPDADLKEEILNLLAWSDPTPMGPSLIAAILNKEETELQKILNEAVTSGSLKGTNRYQLNHDQIEKQQAKFPITGKQEWVLTICQRMGDWFEARRKTRETMPEIKSELTQLQVWLTHVKPYSIYHTARLSWFQAYPPYHQEKYQEALQLVQTAGALLDEAQSPESETEDFFKLKANLYQDFAAVYEALGNLSEALKYYEQSGEIVKQKFNGLPADKAEIMSNIGAFYERNENLEEAIKHFEQALEIRRQHFGESHAETATSFNDIGTCYYEAKKYPDAIEFLQKAVETRQQVLGYESRETNDSLYNLAVCLVNLKKLKDAYERVNRQLKKLSPGHPNYNELAGLLQYIDSESVKSGFRPMSAISAGKAGKKKKKKK